VMSRRRSRPQPPRLAQVCSHNAYTSSRRCEYAVTRWGQYRLLAAVQTANVHIKH
jgi:hypothetical protein